MKYTVLALALLLGAGLVWASATEAPWESSKTETVIEEVEVEVPVDYRCELALRTLADARVALAKIPAIGSIGTGRPQLVRLVADSKADVERYC